MKNNPTKKISLAIFCKGLPVVLKLQLQALKKQSLSPDFWEVAFIFRTEPHFEIKKQIQQVFPTAVILVSPLHQTVSEIRNLAFKELQSPIIYFLDEDVILDKSKHLETVLSLHSKHSSLTAIGGAYLDHPSSSFFGKIYNWIVRIWMIKHYSSSQQDFLPAGNFSIKSHPKFSARFYSPNVSGFGAEELFFFKSLHEEGLLSSWMTELDTNHLARHSFKDFVQRAWLQGRALARKDRFSRRNVKIFIKEPAPLLYKVFALFYLFLVRLSSYKSLK